MGAVNDMGGGVGTMGAVVGDFWWPEVVEAVVLLQETKIPVVR